MIELIIGLGLGFTPPFVLVLLLKRGAEHSEARWARDRSVLLDRIQAPEVSAMRASAQWDDPLAGERPVSWLHDDTGLISTPVYASDREPPADL